MDKPLDFMKREIDVGDQIVHASKSYSSVNVTLYTVTKVLDDRGYGYPRLRVERKGKNYKGEEYTQGSNIYKTQRSVIVRKKGARFDEQTGASLN